LNLQDDLFFRDASSIFSDHVACPAFNYGAEKYCHEITASALAGPPRPIASHSLLIKRAEKFRAARASRDYALIDALITVVNLRASPEALDSSSSGLQSAPIFIYLICINRSTVSSFRAFSLHLSFSRFSNGK